MVVFIGDGLSGRHVLKHINERMLLCLISLLF